MPIIYSYPSKTSPATGDLLLISDVSASNQTKKITIGDLKDPLDVVDSLNSLTGDINITGGTNITVTPSGQNIEISTSASNVDGSGTAGTIPKWSDSNTLTDSIIKDQGGVDVLIPRFIKHDGDTDNLFGFNDVGKFLVSVDATGHDQFRVDAEAITMETDSGIKLSAGPDQVALYNDENGSTTATKASLVTYDSGITVRGGTENSFSRGGGVRFFTSTNNSYVGIVGPTTNGTAYEIILPNAVGTASQVLKLPSTIGTSPYQLSWGDASASSGTGGFQTIPLSNSDAFITATGTFVFQSIVGASLSSTMFFKVFNLLQLSSGRSARVGIFKGSLSEASSATLHSTGSLSGSVAPKTFSAIEMEKADGATDLVVGETIVVCVSVDENISMPGTTTAISNEFIGLFSTSVATTYETLDGLLTSFTFNPTGTRISAILYN